MNDNYEIAREQLIEHCKGHGYIDNPSEKGYERQLELIRKNEGSFTGCLSTICSVYQAKTNYSWLVNKDLVSVKNFAYISTRLVQISDSYLEKTEEYPYTHGYNLMLSDCWFNLLSDHPTLSLYGAKKMQQMRIKHPRDNPKNIDYTLGIIPYAILGQFDILAEKARAQLVLEAKPLVKFRPIHQFYIALSQADLVGMNEAIHTLLSSKSIGTLSGGNTGYTGIHLNYTASNSTTVLSMWATVLAKIAFMHGYELDIDSPYVPKELLPVEPLVAYTDPFDFMLEYPLPA